MNEIKSSPALRYFGAALALTHLLTFYAWFIDHNFAAITLEVLYPACWPFFKNCHSIRPLSESILNIYFVAYGTISLLSFVFFLLKKNTLKFAYFFLVFSLILKLTISILDYRFMGNFHYMCYFVQIAYLFFPNKKKLIPLLIVSFYIGASLVKFNSQWISGEALLKNTFLNGRLLTAACIYVIFLELCLTPFILWGSKKTSSFVFFQLIAFHLFSWHIVGYLYPLMMLLLLSIFPLTWNEEPNKPSNFSLKRIDKKASTFAFLAFFWICQTGPLWFAGDSVQTGEGRIFSLNMLDAKVECQEFLFLKYAHKTIDVSDYNLDEGFRIGCDPLLHLSLAKHHCRKRSQDKDFLNLDISFFSKKNKQSPYLEIFNLKDFCNSKTDYNLFQKNLWITEKALTYKNPVINFQKKYSKEENKTPQKEELSFESTDNGWLLAKNKTKKYTEVAWSFYAAENIFGLSRKPLSDKQNLFVLSANGRLYSFDKFNGNLNWVSYIAGNLSLNFEQSNKDLFLKTKDSKITVSKETGAIVSIVQ